jgi:hypothetical protein
MAEFEVKEQRPAKANAIEHFGENVHSPTLIAWTIGHNLWTILPYRLRNALTSSCHGGPMGHAENHNSIRKNRDFAETPADSRTSLVRHPNRKNQCKIF